MASRKSEYTVQSRRSLHNIKTNTQPRHDEETDDNNDSQEPVEKDSSEYEDDSLSYQQESYKDTKHDKSYRHSESFNTSHSVPRSPERPNVNAAYFEKPEKQSPQVSTAYRHQVTPANQIQLFMRAGHYKFFCVLLILGLTSALVINKFLYTKTERRLCSFKELRQRHPLQADKIWKKLSVGIELILNKDRSSPSVYLFLNQGSRASNDLINEIAAQSSVCFDPKMRPVHMDSSDFSSPRAIKDYGYAIDQYKMKIKEGNVILIVNLNEIPVEAARALHTICDTYSPIAKDVVIFLTLTTTESRITHAEQTATDTLEQLWGSKIDRYELDPLITRVIDQVILLQS